MKLMDMKALHVKPNPAPEYAHSSNLLFHFMKEPKHLSDIIKRKAIVPRYCKEDIRYLNLSLLDEPFKEIAVLLKCFCDIPLTRIKDTLKCKISNHNLEGNSPEERYYSHTDLYGKYGIALTKLWGERAGIQPIHYISKQSTFCEEFSEAMNKVISSTIKIEEIVANNYLNTIAFLKPLSGDMNRTNKKDGNYTVEKNFHDEHEWRFVPKYNKDSYETLIANPHLLSKRSSGLKSTLDIMSEKLEGEENKHYWMHLQYADVVYMIVPDSNARFGLIKFIQSLPEEEDEKYLLASKILVLDEVRRNL